MSTRQIQPTHPSTAALQLLQAYMLGQAAMLEASLKAEERDTLGTTSIRAHKIDAQRTILREWQTRFDEVTRNIPGVPS